MLRPLHDHERSRVLTLSALLCAIPICLAPVAGRSAFELADEHAAFNARFAPVARTVWDDKPVSVTRDPFTPEVSEERALPANTNVVGLQVTQGEPMGYVLPPNRGAVGTPVQDATFGMPSVTAVVTGPSPRALIDDGTRVRVVGVGDVLAGLRIVAIDSSGVHLQNGTLMALGEKR